MLIFAGGILTFTSCAGGAQNKSQEDVAITVSEKFPRRMEELLENGDHLKALALIDRHRREGRQVEEFYQRALEGLKAEWNAARADGDWKRMLNYMRSFRVLGEPLPAGGPENETSVLALGVETLLNARKSGAAALLIQSEMDVGRLGEETRSRWAVRFGETGHARVAAMLRAGRSALSAANSTTAAPTAAAPTAAAPAGALEGSGREVSLPSVPGMEELTDGTVTVWVNRGIRLVGNVGVPDRGIGSGFFIDPEGYILTNYHVIESEVDPSYQGYSRLFIKKTENSPDRIPAKVVGYDKDFDLALLKTEMEVPYVFSFADKALPALGEKIRTIGSPGGLARSLTTGTVSAYARSIQPMAGSLQIDVPINPGNSGGPLLNSRGEVVGMVFAGVESYEGVNFAIPGNYVKQLVPNLYEGGEIELPWMGFSAWDASGRITVVYVVPGSPAHDAGLLPGDVLTGVDGHSFSTIHGLQEYLITRNAGTLCAVSWERPNRALAKKGSPAGTAGKVAGELAGEPAGEPVSDPAGSPRKNHTENPEENPAYSPASPATPPYPQTAEQARAHNSAQTPAQNTGKSPAGRGIARMNGILALGVRPDIPLQTALTRDAREQLLTPLFGFELQRISGSRIVQHYRVTDVLPGSIADESGFTPGDTFLLRRWLHDEEYNVVSIQIILRGRKAGFLESAIQLSAFLDVNTVL